MEPSFCSNDFAEMAPVETVNLSDENSAVQPVFQALLSKADAMILHNPEMQKIADHIAKLARHPPMQGPRNFNLILWKFMLGQLG